MAPALASKTLESWVPPVGCTFMPSINPLTALPFTSTYGNPCPMASRCAVVWGTLSKTSLAIEGAGAASSTPVYTSLPWPLSLGLLWALAGLLPCPALVRAAISLAICCPNSVTLSPESVATAALALTLSWISSFSLSTFQVATINCEYEVLVVL